MEANKLECEKCIRIARSALSAKEFEKAHKFLEKAERLYPTQLAKDLLEELKLDSSKYQKNGENSTERPTSEEPASSETAKRRRKSGSEVPTASKEYSADQIEAVKKIKKCRDFYEILGLPKSASEAELKKAYKKLALQFHPDKNKAPGATEAFKAIGKAFAILSDTHKRQQYDQYGPEMFGEGSEISNTRHSQRSQQRTHNYSSYGWNDEEFSADELFNLFFGGNYAATHSATHRHRHTAGASSSHMPNGANNFTFTSNNYAILFQLTPILLIIFLSLISNLMMGEPLYNLSKTNKYTVKRTTHDRNIAYFVKPDFKIESTSDLKKIERQIEEELHSELRQNCFREKSYKETAIWRARNYGDDRLYKRATEIETPSCDKIHQIFGGG